MIMALKFTNTNATGNFVKTLVYGDAGAGKTVLCSTGPSPLILSAERGLLSIADKNIPVIELSTAQDCFDALAFVQGSAEAGNFETINLDSVTDIAEVMLADYKKQYKDPRQAYGQLADDMGEIIRAFRDLQDKHVYFTAKMISILDEYSGLMKYMPGMPGKTLTRALPFFFDEVLALRVQQDEHGNVWRYLQTTLDMQYVAKDRSGKLDAMEQPDLTLLFNKIMAKKEVNNGMITQATEPADTVAF